MGERDRELELERLRELLPEQPPPSRESQARARARLLQLAGSSGRERQRRGGRGRRPAIRLSVRLPVRLATVGIAAAAVLALLLGPLYVSGVFDRRDDSQAIDPASSSPSVAAEDSAKSVLLGAARQLDELRPEPVGAYWHVRSLISVPRKVGSDPLVNQMIEETWVPRVHGQAFSGSCSLSGKPGPCRLDKSELGFSLGERSMIEYAAVEAIPSEVEALRQYLLARKPRDAGTADQWLFTTASALLVDLPVTPQVRASAFRLLAGLPNVVSQGVVRDSQGRSGTAIALLDKGSDVESTLQLVVDPASGKLLSSRLNAVSVADGKPVKRANVTYLSVGWTDQKPVTPVRTLK